MFFRDAIFERRYARRREKLQAAHKAAIEQAKRDGKDKDAIESIHTDHLTFLNMLDEEIGEHDTQSLLRLAARYRLPTPPIITEKVIKFYTPGANEVTYLEGDVYGQLILTPKAMSELRKAIRQEEKERFDRWARWAPLASVLVALISVTVAFVALVLKVK